MADRVTIDCLERAAAAEVAPFERAYRDIDEGQFPRLARSCFWLLAALVGHMATEVEAQDKFRVLILNWKDDPRRRW